MRRQSVSGAVVAVLLRDPGGVAGVGDDPGVGVEQAGELHRDLLAADGRALDACALGDVGGDGDGDGA